ncbi:hypothetical protein AB4Z01_20155 [Inquilinus sp. YAF38]|uniref:hypothetical protein n=1 Tax=Inquilinus sp. YAF38 TaxID=3233084 RepID=UPI003F8E7461
MMDSLIVWAALGPILAFIAGAVVVACLDDDDDADPPLTRYLRRADGIASVPSFDLYGSSPPPGPCKAWSSDRPARSCLQCGRWEE